MTATAKLEIEGKVYELPIVIGSEGEKAVDITKLRDQTGSTALDDGYGNTGSCLSQIPFIDGGKGAKAEFLRAVGPAPIAPVSA